MSRITVQPDGTLKCACGKVPWSSGFDPCDADGVIDDTLLDAVSNRPLHYVCLGCGAITTDYQEAPSFRAGRNGSP